LDIIKAQQDECYRRVNYLKIQGTFLIVRLNVVVVIEALCTKPTHHEFRISFFPAVQFTLAHVGVLRYRPAACKQALHLLKICLNRWQSISSYT